MRFARSRFDPCAWLRRLDAIAGLGRVGVPRSRGRRAALGCRAWAGLVSGQLSRAVGRPPSLSSSESQASPSASPSLLAWSVLAASRAVVGAVGDRVVVVVGVAASPSASPSLLAWSVLAIERAVVGAVGDGVVVVVGVAGVALGVGVVVGLAGVGVDVGQLSEPSATVSLSSSASQASPSASPSLLAWSVLATNVAVVGAVGDGVVVVVGVAGVALGVAVVVGLARCWRRTGSCRSAVVDACRCRRRRPPRCRDSRRSPRR